MQDQRSNNKTCNASIHNGREPGGARQPGNEASTATQSCATDLVGVWLCKQEVPESLHVFREAHIREIPSMDENIPRRHFQGLGGSVVGICIKRSGSAGV